MDGEFESMEFLRRIMAHLVSSSEDQRSRGPKKDDLSVHRDAVFLPQVQAVTRPGYVNT